MEEPLAKRPWWRKKRWAVPLVIWLLAVYPLSYGPAHGYWWRSTDPRVDQAFFLFYAPMRNLEPLCPDPVRGVMHSYLGLWLPEGWDEPFICILTDPFPDEILPADGEP